MGAASPHKLPSQADLKKVCKAMFDGGAKHVRLEVAGFVIEATRETAEAVASNPLDHWRRTNGQG